MPSCENVHAWIEKQGFETKEEAIRYVKQDYPTRDSNPNLYECIESYDFEYYFAILNHRYPKRKDGTRREGSYLQLHRINRSTHRFAALDLDPQAKSEIFNFLRLGA